MRRTIPRRRVTLSATFARGLLRALRGLGDPAAARAQFEAALAERCGGGEAVAVDSGRNALAASLIALGLKPGAEVLLPDYTLDQLALLVARLGLTPIPVDVDRDDYQLDPARVADALTARTGAVMVTHIFGRPANLTALREVLAGRSVALLEDTAHALDARHAGQPLGSFGRTACLSFASIKAVHCFSGGAVVTRDPELAAQVRAHLDPAVAPRTLLRVAAVTLAEELAFNPWGFALTAGPLLHNPAVAQKAQSLYRGTKGDAPPAPRRLSDFQVRLAGPQLHDLGPRMARRERVAAIYRSRLGARVHLQAVGGDDRPVHYAEVVRLDRPAPPVARALYRRGVDAGTGTQIMQSCSQALGGSPLPNAGELLNNALELPQSERMSEDDAHRVCDALLAVLDERA